MKLLGGRSSNEAAAFKDVACRMVGLNVVGKAAYAISCWISWKEKMEEEPVLCSLF